MNKEYCEKVRISGMVLLDGEVPPLSASEIKKHVESCKDCREELVQQNQAMSLLDGRSRRVISGDIWPKIESAIEAGRFRQTRPGRLVPFLMLCLFLITHKIIEVMPSVTAGLAVKLMPVGVIVLFFCLLKENPLKINQNLRLEGDMR